tara:strand:+ start:5541 stop:5951 length:411 start_codon:yes stop_codon:yes gene_type:complete
MPIIQGIRRRNPLDLNKNVKIGVAFPLNDINLFNGTDTFKEQVKSNLINLLLTKKGERHMLPTFGVGLQDLLFENNIDLDLLKESINNQINIFIPEITLMNLETNYDGEHTVFLKITYRLNTDPQGETDAIQLNFN